MYLVAILAAILNFSSTEHFPDVYHRKSVSTGFSVNNDIQFTISSLICTRECVSRQFNTHYCGGGGIDIGNLGSMNIWTSIGGSGGGGTVIGSPGPGC